MPQNKPDLIIWNCETKMCTTVKCSCPLDTNTIKKVSEKLEVYVPLVRNLQMYPGRKFEIAPIVVEAMRYVPKCLVTCLKMVGFEGKEIRHRLSNSLQYSANADVIADVKSKITVSRRHFFVNAIFSAPSKVQNYQNKTRKKFLYPNK